MRTDQIRAAIRIAVAVVVSVVAVSAEQDERARTLDQQIDRIYQANEYALPRFGPARWLADGPPTRSFPIASIFAWTRGSIIPT